MHVSMWGYYSRFNGGLFSIFSYIFLYLCFCFQSERRRKGRKKKSFEFKKVYIFLAAIAFFIGRWFLRKSKITIWPEFPTSANANFSYRFGFLCDFMKAAPQGIIKTLSLRHSFFLSVGGFMGAAFAFRLRPNLSFVPGHF